MTWLLIWPIAVPVLTAALCLVAWSSGRAQRWISLVGMLALVAGTLLLLQGVLSGGVASVQMGGWAAPFGITLVADTLSAALVFVTAVIGLGVAVYALTDLDPGREVFGFHPLFHALLTGVGGSFLTGDIFNLYVWFEVMVIASFGLMALGGERRQVDGAVKYVVLNLVATATLLGAIALLYGVTGTLNMADLGRTVADHQAPARIAVIATLFLIAFGMKAAVFPLYFWLPASYHTPAAAVSAVFAALLTKVGVYAVVRTFTLIFTVGESYTNALILVIAVLTMLTGVLGAIAQTEVRRVLSFNLVSGIGVILAGVGLDTQAGLTGALVYTLHHIVVMAALFMAAGVIERATGTGNLNRLGSLYLERPWLAVIFFVAAMSLAGVPPLSGFWPKVLLVQASLDADAFIIAAAVLVTGLLTLYSMAKVWALGFWRNRPAPGEAPGPVSGGGQVAMSAVPLAVMALLTVLIGLWAQPVVGVAQRSAGELMAPSDYIGAVLGQAT
ncbi:multisubunit sodium/proton antiporter, MrpD subunit [Limimonas halophila]|uniref:Multisubunit sodium/proton antiporter, MrpD subunit n=1 Tax=Limimonas halophila TaxID=1082479 RepID=A0A1G7NSW1_9PROT|nr:Na+/H+ antiporter subunit D [Limimonas halophila]SDF77076.1 multisubunit sodium/proton antiporter, MrpD subunit [Limimonas halophila]